MGEKRATKNARENQHRHALDRLQERYWQDATHEDLIAIRDIAKENARVVKPLPGYDSKQVFVRYRDRLIHVVYVPRHNAIRTVLPCEIRY